MRMCDDTLRWPRLWGRAVLCFSLLAFVWTSAASAQPPRVEGERLDTAELDPNRAEPAPVVAEDGRRDNKRYGWIRIYTNYDALVTVDGEPYPKRSEYGMKVEAGEQHEIHVSLGDKEKNYVIVVRPREMRTLLVDLTGYNTPPSPSRSKVGRAAARASRNDDDDDDDEKNGKLTVYSKPKGEVYIDGKPVGATTPMINRELDVGRHEIQVKWDGGKMSEVKTIRIRKGSKLKLFFRDRDRKR